MATLVAFIGDPNHPGTDPETVTVYGYTFPRGVWVEIDDYAHPMAGAKLQANGHFTVLDWSGPLETLEPPHADDTREDQGRDRD